MAEEEPDELDETVRETLQLDSQNPSSQVNNDAPLNLNLESNHFSE